MNKDKFSGHNFITLAFDLQFRKSIIDMAKDENDKTILTDSILSKA